MAETTGISWAHSTFNPWAGCVKVSDECDRCYAEIDIMEENPQLTPFRADLWPRLERCENLDLMLLTKRPQNFRRFLPLSWLDNPLPNVWGMTTAGTEASRWRIDALRQTPFAVRGVSMEPLLSPMPELNLSGIHWVIVGGESQHGARPMRPEWALDIRDQCIAANVAFHFKQWGEHNSDLIRIGTKKAGSELDGREWKEFPKVAL